MQAVYCSAYGKPNVLEVRNVPVPEIGNNEILIKNIASSITRADALMRSGNPKFARLFLGLRKLKNPIMGTGFSGEVIKLGEHVKAFKVGDLVYGETTLNFGTNAPYVKLSEEKDIVRKLPKIIEPIEAATLCDGVLTSYNFLKSVGALKAGQEVLVIGASGALGTAAIQLGKSFGAKVTGVCSAKNEEMVRQLGADVVIVYNQDNFLDSNTKYDLIYDTIGVSSFEACKPKLKAKGRYISPVLSGSLLMDMFTTCFSQKKAKFEATGLKSKEKLNSYLEDIERLLFQGALKNKVSKTFRMEEIVEAHKLLDSGRKQGNIALIF